MTTRYTEKGQKLRSFLTKIWWSVSRPKRRQVYLDMLGVSHTRYYEILGYYQILVSSHYERLWETDLKTIIFAFLTILDNSKHFLKISIFVPKKVHIMVILGWNFLFWSRTFGLDFDFYSSFLHQYLAKFKELIILYTWNAFLRHC